MLDSLLDHLARSRGIGDAYYDYRGELKAFSPATKTAILAAMGCRVDDAAAIEHEIAELDAERWRSVLPPVAVVRPGRTGVVIALPADQLDRPLDWSLQLADGSSRAGCVRSSDLTEGERREVDGRWLTRRLLVLPDDLPRGYHDLSARAPDGSEGRCTLIVAPGRCYEPVVLSRGQRFWGVAVQLYTLRSATNWGIGDFADLETVVRRCAPHGASFVGLNPLHALFPANPSHFSPYSPSTRHFLNVLYIAVEALPEFEECATARQRVEAADFQRELQRLRSVPSVDYPGVANAKLPVLAELYEHFRREHLGRDSERARAFRLYQRERGEPLRLHALHDAIDAHLRREDAERHWGWPAWPQELRDPTHRGVREFEQAHLESVQFYAWLQWLADEQLRGVQALARELGMPLGLYGDYAVGVNPSGSETWSDQNVYRMGAGVGAPPDPLALKGQDWGIPPQDPHALIAEHYRPFRDLVAANMRHFGALRLDHVMALFRQWWVPVGLGATEGGYVHYPLDDLMSVLALESERHRCLVIGEDLGTVPDEMRHAMAEYAVYSYKVLLFEKKQDGRFKRPEEYVRRAIATVTTHDLPTLRGYWEGSDLELRDRLNLFPGEEIRRHVVDERVRDRAQMLAALDGAGLCPEGCSGSDATFSDALARAIHLYLAKSAAALVVLQIEDLIGMTDPVNVPGTSHEHANWQRKVTADLLDALGREATLRLFADVQVARSS
jgi:4-alpha-glucanotransferase